MYGEINKEAILAGRIESLMDSGAHSMPCVDMPAPGSMAWWCSGIAASVTGRCPQCQAVAEWNAAGADPDRAPSFLLPDAEL